MGLTFVRLITEGQFAYPLWPISFKRLYANRFACQFADCTLRTATIHKTIHARALIKKAFALRHRHKHTNINQQLRCLEACNNFFYSLFFGYLYIFYAGHTTFFNCNSARLHLYIFKKYFRRVFQLFKIPLNRLDTRHGSVPRQQRCVCFASRRCTETKSSESIA